MNVKLNLNFDLYKGTTRLKQWWKEVKAHFTQVQEAHNALDTTVSTHKTAAIIDHPNKSVTTEKIADRSITRDKLSFDILSEIAKIPEFLYYDVEPVYLTDCIKTAWGYDFPPGAEMNKFFKLENDTDNALTEFRGHDDYYIPLSCAINPGETRICVLLKKPSGGADPQNGYLFVLDDTDTKRLINKETLERKNTDTTLQQNIDTEAVNRQTADNALDGRIATVWKDMYGRYIVDGSFSDSDFQVQVDSSYSNATVTVTAGKSIKINGVQVSLPASFTISRISPADNVIQLYAEYDTTAKTIEWYCDSSSTYWPYYLNDNILQVYTCQIYFDLVYTDGVLVDVRPTVTSVGNIGLEITKNLSDLKTENKNSFLDAVNENAEKINYFISLRPSDREIFVMCNGDHDELKIQAALDAVKTGGVVYPVTSSGGAVVLTNANTNEGYSPISSYDVVLKVGTNKTIDFRFCEGVMFDNTNPGNNQAIFQLSQYAQIKNLWTFLESTDTCTAESINPTVLYTANYCIVDNCNFDAIQGMNTTTASQYLFRVGQYCKYRNNTLNGISLNNITTSQRGFDFGTGTVVENNLFQNITASSYTSAKVFYFTRCNVEKNTFTTFDLGGNAFHIASGWVNDNYFMKTNNTHFRFAGIVKGNIFQTITASEHDTTFLADDNSEVVDNVFQNITANNSYALVTVSSNATFSNKMYTITPPSSADMPVVYLDDGAVFKENEVRLKSGTDTAIVVMAEDGSTAAIKDNITNAASIGTYSSTCVVEGNITGFRFGA